MNNNPYVVVGSPDYATPVLNMFGDQKQKPGQQNQAQQPNQANQANQTTQPNYFQMLLQKLFSRQPGQPMQLGPSDPSQGSLGGTAGGLPPIY